MPSSPLAFPCLHLATAQELARDPHYTACNAEPGQPCHWANRYDGQLNPPFHSERLEQLLSGSDTPLDPTLLRETILDTGLV